MRSVFLLLCLTLTLVKSHRYLGPRYIDLGLVGILRPRFIRGPGSGVIDFRTLRSGGTSIGSVRGPSFVSRTTRVSTFGDSDGGFDVGGSDGATFVTSSTYRPRTSLVGAPGSVRSFTSSTRGVTSIPSSIYPIEAPDVTDESVSYDELYGRVAGPTGPFSPGTSVGSLPSFGFPDDSTPDGVPGGPVPGGPVPGDLVTGGYSSVVESVGTPGPLSGYTEGSYTYQGPAGPIGRGTLSAGGSSVLPPGYIDRSGTFGPADEGTSYEELFGDNSLPYNSGSSAGIRSVNTGSTSSIRSFAFETRPTYRRIEFVGRPRVVSVRRSTYGDSSVFGTGTDDYVDAGTSLSVTRGGSIRGGRILSEADAYGRGSQSGRIFYGPGLTSSRSYRFSSTNIPYRTSDTYQTV